MKQKLELGYADNDADAQTSSESDNNTVILMKMDKKTGLVAPALSSKVGNFRSLLIIYFSQKNHQEAVQSPQF